MNEQNLIDEFFKDVRRRSPSKGTAQRGHVADAVEDNLVHAQMGFGFKCGICGKRHGSAIVEKVSSVKACIQKLVVKYTDLGKGQMKTVLARSRHGTQFNRRYYHPIRENRSIEPGEVGYKFSPDPSTPDTLTLVYREKNPLNIVAPANKLLEAICPKFVARCTAETERFEQVFAREMIDDVSIREALGAPDTFEYVEARASALKVRAEKQLSELVSQHAEENKEFLSTVENWRTIKPERWSVKGREYLTRFKMPAWMSTVKPLERVTVNGKGIYEGDLVKSFHRIIAFEPVTVKKPSNYHRYVPLDIALVDGYPALSWASLNCRSYSRRKDAGKVTNMSHYLSLWNGRVFMNRYIYRENFSVADAWTHLDQDFIELSRVIKDKEQVEED